MLREWAEGWCTVAWGSWQDGRKVDAQAALRHIDRAGMKPLRARFLRGEIALSEGNKGAAREIWEDAVEAGGRDFRVLVGLGALLEDEGEHADAERMFLLAEESFPGYDDRQLSAELRLASFYAERGDQDAANRAKERWLAWNAGELNMRREVAAWHVAAGRHAEAAQLFAEANEIDPFLRDLHRDWAHALRETGRFEEALREYRVALIVPPELDRDYTAASMGPFAIGPAAPAEPEALTDEERAELTAYAALCLKELGREEESRAEAQRALELDEDCELARELWK